MISLEKWMILTPLQKLPKSVGDLGKLLVAKALNGCPKWNKSYLVTLTLIQLPYSRHVWGIEMTELLNLKRFSCKIVACGRDKIIQKLCNFKSRIT